MRRPCFLDFFVLPRAISPLPFPLYPTVRQASSACQSGADTAQLTPKVREERRRERDAREGEKGEQETQGRERERASQKKSPSGCVSSLQSRQCIILHSCGIVCVSPLETLGRASWCNMSAKLLSSFAQMKAQAQVLSRKLQFFSWPIAIAALRLCLNCLEVADVVWSSVPIHRESTLTRYAASKRLFWANFLAESAPLADVAYSHIWLCFDQTLSTGRRFLWISPNANVLTGGF